MKAKFKDLTIWITEPVPPAVLVKLCPLSLPNEVPELF